MGESKLVSVIIPVYNNEALVGRCIRSFIGQTFKDIEIIVVNDGSTDNTLSVCMECAAQDARVKVVDKVKEGVSMARNAGLDASCGDYICFADSDDYVESDYVERLLELLERYDADCSCCDKVTELADGSVISDRECEEKITVLDSEQLDFRDSSYPAVVIQKLYRANVLRPNGQWLRFDPELVLAQDSYFAALALPHIGKLVKTSRRLYHYVRHGTNATFRPKFKKRIFEIRSWNKIYELGQTLGERYAESAKYELVVRCFRVHRATVPENAQERKISRQLVRYMRKNRSYILRELEYPAKLRLIFIITLIFPWLTRGMNRNAIR